jgi:hypothetical protein
MAQALPHRPRLGQALAAIRAALHPRGHLAIRARRRCRPRHHRRPENQAGEAAPRSHRRAAPTGLLPRPATTRPNKAPRTPTPRRLVAPTTTLSVTASCISGQGQGRPCPARRGKLQAMAAAWATDPGEAGRRNYARAQFTAPSRVQERELHAAVSCGAGLPSGIRLPSYERPTDHPRFPFGVPITAGLRAFHLAAAVTERDSGPRNRRLGPARVAWLTVITSGRLPSCRSRDALSASRDALSASRAASRTS